MRDLTVEDLGNGTVRMVCPSLSEERMKMLRAIVDVHELVVSPRASEFVIAEAERERFEEFFDKEPVDVGRYPTKITFYYDYISPFSYLGVSVMEDVRERWNVVIDWKPWELSQPWSAQSEWRWWYEPEVSADRWDVRKGYVHAAGLPMRDLRPEFRAVSRPVLLACEYAKDQGRFVEFLMTASKAYFTDGRDLRDWAAIESVAREVGLDASLMTAAVFDERYVPRIEAARRTAESQGVFGAPTVVVGDTLLWGRNVRATLERELARMGTTKR